MKVSSRMWLFKYASSDRYELGILDATGSGSVGLRVYTPSGMQTWPVQAILNLDVADPPSRRGTSGFPVKFRFEA